MRLILENSMKHIQRLFFSSFLLSIILRLYAYDGNTRQDEKNINLIFAWKEEFLPHLSIKINNSHRFQITEPFCDWTRRNFYFIHCLSSWNFSILLLYSMAVDDRKKKFFYRHFWISLLWMKFRLHKTYIRYK